MTVSKTKEKRLRLHIGDVFEIRKRYDRGDFPFIRIARVHGRAVFVVDLDRKRRLVDGGRERQFRCPARITLTKYWKRSKL